MPVTTRGAALTSQADADLMHLQDQVESPSMSTYEATR